MNIASQQAGIRGETWCSAILLKNEIASQQAGICGENWCCAILVKNEHCVSTGTDLYGNVVHRHLVESWHFLRDSVDVWRWSSRAKHVGMWRSGVTARMCDISTGWRRVVSFTSLPPYQLGEGVSGFLWIGSWVGLGAGVNVPEAWKISYPCRESKSRSLARPALTLQYIDFAVIPGRCPALENQ
jgi:hypothetical protein